MLLQSNRIGELLLADRAGVLGSGSWTGLVAHEMCTQIAPGGEGSATHFAFEGPLTSMLAIMQAQCSRTAQHPEADDTLVRSR